MGDRASVLGCQGRFRERGLEGWPGPAAWRLLQPACTTPQVGHGACPPQAPAKAACMACVRVPRSRGPAAARLPTLEQWRGMLGCLGGDGWLRDRRLGKQLQRARKRGEALGCSLEGLRSPKALGQRSASGVCTGP